jgi:hypothetical protein
MWLSNGALRPQARTALTHLRKMRPDQSVCTMPQVSHEIGREFCRGLQLLR